MRRASTLGLLCGLLSSLGCLTGDSPCCDQSADCAPGLVCFEHVCAPRCDDQTPCENDGLVCDANGVCVAAEPNPRCATEQE